MRTMGRVILTLLAMASLTLQAAEVKIDTKPTKGDPKAVIDTNAKTAVDFKAGKEEPKTVEITVALDKPATLSEIELVSESPNKWFGINNYEVYGDLEGKGVFTLIGKGEWYDRKDDNRKKIFTKKIKAGDKKFHAVQVVLKRRHQFIWMRLNEIKLHKADGSSVHGEVSTISSSLPADKGNLEKLYNGENVQWNGGKGKPSKVILTVDLKPGAELESLELISKSANKWWYISKVKIEGMNNGIAVKTLLDKDWYTLKENSPAKTYDLKCAVNSKFEKLQITLIRPHGFINMNLYQIKLNYKNLVSSKIQTKWDTYFQDNKFKVNVFIDSRTQTEFTSKLELFKLTKKKS